MVLFGLTFDGDSLIALFAVGVSLWAAWTAHKALKHSKSAVDPVVSIRVVKDEERTSWYRIEMQIINRAPYGLDAKQVRVHYQPFFSPRVLLEHGELDPLDPPDDQTLQRMINTGKTDSWLDLDFGIEPNSAGSGFNKVDAVFYLSLGHIPEHDGLSMTLVMQTREARPKKRRVDIYQPDVPWRRPA